jgi:uncharacterized protein YndB with AHSA1/START domain
MRLRTILKVLAGALLTLAVLIVVALRVNTTGSYQRTFNASADRVWRVWTDPDAIRQWWGPTGYSAPIIRNDPRVGGTWLWSMKSPKGEMSWTTGVYTEVRPDARLVSTMSFADSTGRPIPGANAPVPGHWPDSILVTTEFTESGGKTTVTVTEVGIPLFVKFLATIAWTQQFDKVATLL